MLDTCITELLLFPAPCYLQPFPPSQGGSLETVNYSWKTFIKWRWAAMNRTNTLTCPTMVWMSQQTILTLKTRILSPNPPQSWVICILGQPLALSNSIGSHNPLQRCWPHHWSAYTACPRGVFSWTRWIYWSNQTLLLPWKECYTLPCLDTLHEATWCLWQLETTNTSRFPPHLSTPLLQWWVCFLHRKCRTPKVWWANR